MKKQLTDFWKPQEQVARYMARPRMEKEKHWYFYSNQFMLSDGTVVDARP
jgi:choline-sulfatase